VYILLAHWLAGENWHGFSNPDLTRPEVKRAIRYMFIRYVAFSLLLFFLLYLNNVDLLLSSLSASMIVLALLFFLHQHIHNWLLISPLSQSRWIIVLAFLLLFNLPLLLFSR
jgi:hypothetical protein